MSKIIVNPTLYITCRLCLEDLGVYQIVPEVKEQISYCFGINIELFDGLPPLICNSCEKAVSQYSELKKKFIKKQQELLTKISGHNGKAQMAPVPASTTPVPAPTTPVAAPTAPVAAPTAPVAAPTAPVPLPAPKPGPKQVSAPSPPSTVRPETPKVNNIENNVRRSRSRSSANTPSEHVSEPGDHISEQISWKKEYIKKYQCRFCFLSFANKKYLKVHLAKHKPLKSKYKHVFRNFLQVKIPKVDKTPNLTDSDKRVVLNKNKIIESRRTDHFIVYLNGDENANPNPLPVIKSRNSSECSDIEISMTYKRAKRRRIRSSSSNETVILDEKNNGQTKIQTPVSINDSDDETIPTTTNRKTALKNIANENSKDGAIGSIISECSKKYDNRKSDYHISENLRIQIKRKILSFGRKIINSKSFNSNVLLKFLHYKNLDIAWVSRSVMQNNTTESNFVKIQTRKKNDSDKDKIDTNWVDHSPTKDDLQFSYEQCCIGCDNNYVVEPAVSVTPIIGNTPNKQSNEISVTDMSDSAVLCSLMTNDTKKLLNANPVANPKQLPKKLPTVEKLSPKMTTALEPETFMPIITSTTSLAEKPVADAPRIKVKPVSELMSKESLRLLDTNPRANMCQNETVTENPSQPVSSIYCIPGNVMTISNNISTVNTANWTPFTNTIVSASGNITEAPKNTTEYVIVDTVKLPNAKTISPFNNTIVSAGGSITEAPKNTSDYEIVDTVKLPNAKTISPFNNTVVSANGNITEAPTNTSEYMLLHTVELPNTKTISPLKYFRSLLHLHSILLLDPNVELSIEFECLIRFKVRYNQETKGQPLVLGLSLFCHQNVFCIKVKGQTQEDIDMSKITANWQWEILKIYKGDVAKKMLDNAAKMGKETLEYTTSFVCLLKSINVLPIDS